MRNILKLFILANILIIILIQYKWKDIWNIKKSENNFIFFYKEIDSNNNLL